LPHIAERKLRTSGRRRCSRGARLAAPPRFLGTRAGPRALSVTLTAATLRAAYSGGPRPQYPGDLLNPDNLADPAVAFPTTAALANPPSYFRSRRPADPDGAVHRARPRHPPGPHATATRRRGGQCHRLARRRGAGHTVTSSATAAAARCPASARVSRPARRHGRCAGSGRVTHHASPGRCTGRNRVCVGSVGRAPPVHSSRRSPQTGEALGAPWQGVGKALPLPSRPVCWKASRHCSGTTKALGGTATTASAALLASARRG